MEGAVYTLPGMDLARLADPVAGFFLVMLRIGAFLIASPAFGGRYCPLPVRIVATVCLALAVAGQADLPGAEDLARLSAVPMMVAEMMLGLAAGLILTVLFSAAALAGDRIANAAGLGFAMQVDPSAGGQSPVVAQIFGLAMLMVFLALDGHLAAIRLVLDSYSLLPPGQMPDLAALAVAGLRTGGVMFSIASALMLPVVAALLVLNVGVGVVTRSAPQLNLFSIGFPIAIIAALVLLWLTAPLAGQGMAGIVGIGLELIAAILTPPVGAP